jgi:DMSO/TMAO reductase YedYZ molybdopterin-dependent catalytic subunit
MLSKKRTRLILTSLVAALLLLAVGVLWLDRTGIDIADLGGAVKELKSVEIKNYQGKRLSSVYDFRENSIKGPQHVDRQDYRLKISGLVQKPKTYQYEQVINGRQLYKKVVTLNCVEGWSVTILWEGVLVRDLIKEAGPSSKAKVVIFRAHDGYSTSFPIDYIMKNDIIMAHKMNGVTIPPERGFPFELVAEQKWGYKWIKWIEKIELSSNTDFRGYWERRGYSNEGDLDKGYFK